MQIDESLFINKKVETYAEVPYAPKHTFADFKLDPRLLRNLEQKKFTHPSPIQDQAIPHALAGKDIIGIANTGTGKTAAFLLPIIMKFVANPEHKALVLAPTRELAQQIETEFRSFSRGLGLYSVACVGGAPIRPQIAELRKGVHIVIGTPGRVKDLVQQDCLSLDLFGTVVLDEADRMLDMGFIADMREILGMLPEDRQSMFFSATFSDAIQNLCKTFLKEPVTVSVKTRDTAASVYQDVVRVPHPSKKIDLLHDILIKPECSKVLIFRGMKRTAEELHQELVSRGFKSLALHGDMRNRERERAVKALGSGTIHILIATDVAARGIDIPDITHVINYDLPSDYETYTHRIGRTGRGKANGVALTFVG